MIDYLIGDCLLDKTSVASRGGSPAGRPGSAE
jgi:hypothetical protein